MHSEIYFLKHEPRSGFPLRGSFYYNRQVNKLIRDNYAVAYYLLPELLLLLLSLLLLRLSELLELLLLLLSELLLFLLG